MTEEAFAETPQPTESKPTNWSKVVLVAFLGLGLLTGAAYAGYWYGTESSNLKSQIQEESTPSTTQTPMPIDRVIPPPGGDCRYDTYRGLCTITSIEKTEESKHQEKVIGGPGYEGYKIRYFFESTDTIPQEWQESVFKEHTLQLANSWYPGPEFIEKYKIKHSKKFDCSAELITKGTCTPTLFRFEEIDTTDYFETKR